ncbi:MAG TPA: aldo/keto reductase [Streptosporangiaceae bacterium]|nr:aldo/keto reductase [Streptosporangiaceae bacterium]
MIGDYRDRVRMPAAALGAGGPVVSRIGLGLAALGRPAYITSGREEDLPDRSVAGMRARAFSVLDAAYAAGVRYVDAARSYGRAEEFLAGWLAERGRADVTVGSKWGYRYTGGWRLDAPQQEVKEHSLAVFTSQLAESRALLGDRIALYQVHSLTLDSGLFTDAPLLGALSRLRGEGVIIGLSTSGPRQAEAIRRALSLTVDGQQLFTSVQLTWNLLEPSAGPAAAEAAEAGWAVLVKEPVANGRLTPAGAPPAPLTELAAARGVTEDAIALAAALAQPWASVVLSGAVTVAQLDANLAALTVGDLPPLGLAEAPGDYWAERAARPWH